MGNQKKTIIIVSIIGSAWLLSVTSCGKEEMTRSVDMFEDTVMINDSVNIDDRTGVSFDMESDSLTEEIEEVYFI